MIINASNLDKLRVGFTSLFQGAFNAVNPQWSKIAMLVTSTGKEQKYGWLGSTTKFREWLGDRVIQNLKSHDFTIVNKSYENTIGVDRDDIEDDSLGVYAPMLQQMGDDAARHPDELIFSLLANSFSTLCYDGQYFVDIDHPVVDKNGVTQSVSNSGGGSGSAWFLMDTRKPIKPLIFQQRRKYEFVAKDDPTDGNVFNKKEFQYGVDARVNVGVGLWQLIYGSKQPLDATNFNAGRTAMQSVTRDGGAPFGAFPNLLVVGPSNEKAALELAKAERNAAGATNVFQGTIEVLVVPYL